VVDGVFVLLKHQSKTVFSEIIVMAAQPTPKAKRHIQDRVEKEQCLCCEKKSLKRGLCYQCYYKWRTTRNSLPSATKRAAFDSKLIRTGKLLRAQAVREYKTEDVFSKAASEVA
jgi:hypothetical protein